MAGILSGLGKSGGARNNNKLTREGVYILEIVDGAVIKPMRSKHNSGRPCNRLTAEVKVVATQAGGDTAHKENEIAVLPLFEHSEYSIYFQREVAGLAQAIGQSLGMYEPEVAATMEPEDQEEYLDGIVDKLFCSDGQAAKGIPFICQVSVDEKGYAQRVYKPLD